MWNINGFECRVVGVEGVVVSFLNDILVIEILEFVNMIVVIGVWEDMEMRIGFDGVFDEFSDLFFFIDCND